MDTLIELVFRVVGIVIGFCVGGFNERRHLRRLDEREAALDDMIVTNLKRIDDPETIAHSTLAIGQVVIATDYFKTTAALLRNIVGGEMRAALSLLTRARREALVRLLEEAHAIGASEVWNVRFQFTNVGQMRGKSGAIQVEMIAYGTAVRRAA
jgi:uncharacterized protein YbjQ (UPF0145 family)